MSMKVSTSARAHAPPKAAQRHTDPMATTTSFSRGNSRTSSPSRAFGRTSSFVSPGRSASVSSKVEATTARLRQEEELWEMVTTQRHAHQQQVKMRADEISEERRRAAERQYQKEMERSRERCQQNDTARRSHNSRVREWYKKRDLTVQQQKDARRAWELQMEEKVLQKGADAAQRHHQILQQRSQRSNQKRTQSAGQTLGHLSELSQAQQERVNHSHELEQRKSIAATQAQEVRRSSAQQQGVQTQNKVHQNVIRAKRIEAERQAMLLRKIEAEEARSNQAKMQHHLELEQRRQRKQAKADQASIAVERAKQAQQERAATFEEDFEATLTIGEQTREHNQRVWRARRSSGQWF